jgi:ATP-dependent DNA helicase Q1
MCDHCSSDQNSETEMEISDIGEAARNILVKAKDSDLKMTALKLVEALRGRGPSNLKLASWKAPKTIVEDKNLAESFVAHLLMENYLKEDFHFTPYR